MKQRSDIKLEVDRLSEGIILEIIRKEFGADSILSEEAGLIKGTTSRTWIVDPLDGTVNFYYGLPYFCCSIACYQQAPGGDARASKAAALGTPLVGVIYMPLLDELFLGVAGQQATLNGMPIHASPATALEESIIATGFGKTEEGMNRMLSGSSALSRRVRKLRCLGAAAYDLANVACGRLTGVFEKGLHAWDIAAGRVILEAAGGALDAFEYEPGRWDVVACGRGILPALRDAVRGEEA